MAADPEANPTTRRSYKAPYTSHRPIPTIQKYNREKEERKSHAGTTDDHSSLISESEQQEHNDAADRYLYPQEQSDADSNNSDVDRQSQDGTKAESQDDKKHGSQRIKDKLKGRSGAKDASDLITDTSEALVEGRNLKERRKAFGKRKGERAAREVTDPVTHLPVRIHDLQPSDLKRVPENLAPPGSETKTATGLGNKTKSDETLNEETQEIGRHHEALENLFPPPDFDDIRKGLARIHKWGVTIGMLAMGIVGTLLVAVDRHFHPRAEATELDFTWTSLWPYLTSMAVMTSGVALVAAAVLWTRKWTDKQVHNLWEEEVWHTDKHTPRNQQNGEETTQWLNNILGSLWPLINPDLFVSLADTLEDVMQASLPSVVRMVSIEDIGQGSESLRVLGVRWLPTGAAARSVTANGKLSSRPQDKPNDRSAPGGQVDDSAEAPDENEQTGDEEHDKSAAQKQEEEQVAEGMEAEEGDFINLEVAFAYRTRSSSRKFHDRAKHAHLYIAFYLPGGIKVPVYVDLRGIVGIARCRLQLTPDPPFFALCTFTLLGQPSVDVSCTPLTRKGLNIMNLPLISHFVQSAVDAAMAEYVAPKSMTLNLQDMISGEDFKKDTRARGIIVARIKRAFGFKQGDPAIPLIQSEGSADPYVSVGWAKFVKPLWSTRVILSEMEPCWEETAFILVTPEELNVDERLRIQLWDSDRFTADDDLGRIELDLKELIRNPETRGKMSDRVDGFKALHAGEGLPGKLEWSVGYFSKTHITEEQLKQQTAEPEIRSQTALDEKVAETSKRKLREAKKDESSEVEQLRLQQYKELEDSMLISAPPEQEHPSGILAIQIHEATGLEVRAQHNASRYNDDAETSGYEEQGEELPSTYCNIILNHQKIYRTRVKPKNAKPFFNAGTERFIRDWRTTEVYIVVRDARLHEDDPIMGIVRLSLGDVFKHRAQINNTYPLYGGVGYGRVRVSLVFRSVTATIPRQLLGWEWGTLVLQPQITASDDLPSDLQSCRLKLQTSINVAHMHHQRSSDSWVSRHKNGVHLGVRRRYSSVLIIQFRKEGRLVDKTAAFAILWLCDIPDNEDVSLTLDVWKGDLKRATTCYLKTCGEKVGSIQLKARFCRGLSRYHQRLTKHDQHLSDVMEVVETARYQMMSSDQEDPGALKGVTASSGQERGSDPKAEGDSDNDSASSSDSSSDSSSSSPASDTDDEHPSRRQRIKRHFHKRSLTTGGSDDQDNKRNVVDSLQEYHKHGKHINRRHRGVMQFKSARTLWWMKHKVEHVQDRISGVFDHHERATGIESEA